MWTVYRHTSPSGKMYIGITSKTLEERCGRNGKGYKKNTVFGRAIQKYGWNNISHEIICENLTKEQAKQMEIELIAKYKTTDRNFGYNMTAGGEGTLGLKQTEESNRKRSETERGRKKGPLSEEQKVKISKSLTGRHLSKETKAKQSASLKGENHPFYGKHHKDETRQKLSEAIKGRHWYNNGAIQLQAFECPAGFVPGMIKRA